MTDEALYSLLRFVPDLARGEAFNVGVVLWADDITQYRVDDEALDRAASANPRLDRGGLAGIKLALGNWLQDPAMSPEAATTEGAPLAYLEVTEPRMTRLNLGDESGADPTLDRLVARLVSPHRRGGGGSFHPARALESALRPLLQQAAVVRHQPFVESRSGVEREVDFFVNSTTNLAVDTMQLAVKKADEILRRADAEAFKVEDILAQNQISFLVFCHFMEAADYHDVNEKARRIMTSVGAQVVDDIEEAAERVTAAATRE